MINKNNKIDHYCFESIVGGNEKGDYSLIDSERFRLLLYHLPYYEKHKEEEESLETLRLPINTLFWTVRGSL